MFSSVKMAPSLVSAVSCQVSPRAKGGLSVVTSACRKVCSNSFSKASSVLGASSSVPLSSWKCVQFSWGTCLLLLLLVFLIVMFVGIIFGYKKCKESLNNIACDLSEIKEAVGRAPGSVVVEEDLDAQGLNG